MDSDHNPDQMVGSETPHFYLADTEERLLLSSLQAEEAEALSQFVDLLIALVLKEEGYEES